MTAAEKLSDPRLRSNVPAEEYHQRRIGVVSKSALDRINRSPLHYLEWLRSGGEETAARTFGRAFHCAVLEPDVFAATYATEPDFGDCRFKANKAARDEWRAEHAGSILLAADDDAIIRGMADALRAHPLASRMLDEGEPEVTVEWTDPETGLPCKCRADYYVRRRSMVADVKSTQDASWEHFRRDVVKYRYHVQDALYRDGFAAVGQGVEHFVFIAVEKTPPHAIAIYSLDADGVGRGYTAARRDIDRMAECVRTNKWPGYDPGIQVLDLPPWA